MNLDVAASVLQKTNQFLYNFKETGLQSSIIAARELAEELEMTPDEMTFPRSADVRWWWKKVQIFMKHLMNQRTIPMTVIR